MTPGHADAQYMFLALGRALGFETRRTWSRGLPTDGVWLVHGDDTLLPAMPAVALEVVVSEGPKSVKGSIDTLAEVSPALAVLVINEAEIRRSAIRRGVDAARVERSIAARIDGARDRVARHQQRFELWSYQQLARRYRLVTGASGSPTLARLAA